MKAWISRNWLSVLVILALIFFAYKCGKGKAETKVVTLPGKDQIKIQNNDEVIRKKVADSFNSIIRIKDNQAIKANDKYDVLMQEYLTKMDEAQTEAKVKVPDTCLPYQRKMIAQITELSLKNTEKDKAAKEAILFLQDGIKERNNFLKQKDKDFDTLKVRWQTCIDNTKKLEKITAKREITLNAGGMGNYAGQLNPALGGGIGYRSKKGFEIKGTVYTNKIVTINTQIPLFRF